MMGLCFLWALVWTESKQKTNHVHHTSSWTFNNFTHCNRRKWRKLILNVTMYFNIGIKIAVFFFFFFNNSPQLGECWASLSSLCHQVQCVFLQNHHVSALFCQSSWILKPHRFSGHGYFWTHLEVFLQKVVFSAMHSSSHRQFCSFCIARGCLQLCWW